MSGSPRLSLAFLSAGQVQKEVTHNEAIQALDFLVSAAVEEGPRIAPPASPVIGACYIVAASPSGAWAGQAQRLACYSSGGWRFLSPVEGQGAYVKTQGEAAFFRSGAWEFGVVRGTKVVLGGQQVVGVRGSAVALPSGGSVVDTEARNAIGSVLAALRQHGLIAP